MVPRTTFKRIMCWTSLRFARPQSSRSALTQCSLFHYHRRSSSCFNFGSSHALFTLEIKSNATWVRIRKSLLSCFSASHSLSSQPTPPDVVSRARAPGTSNPQFVHRFNIHWPTFWVVKIHKPRPHRTIDPSSSPPVTPLRFPRATASIYHLPMFHP